MENHLFWKLCSQNKIAQSGVCEDLGCSTESYLVLLENEWNLCEERFSHHLKFPVAQIPFGMTDWILIWKFDHTFKLWRSYQELQDFRLWLITGLVSLIVPKITLDWRRLLVWWITKWIPPGLPSLEGHKTLFDLTSAWFFFRYTSSSFRPSICISRSERVMVRSSRTFLRPAISASTDRRMANSFSYLKSPRMVRMGI